MKMSKMMEALGRTYRAPVWKAPEKVVLGIVSASFREKFVCGRPNHSPDEQNQTEPGQLCQIKLSNDPFDGLGPHGTDELANKQWRHDTQAELHGHRSIHVAQRADSGRFPGIKFLILR
jgi:hypothetical protein